MDRKHSMRRGLGWVLLAGLVGLLGGSAIATPMTDKDYATQIVQEVNMQNVTCTEIEYLEHVFEEMLERCAPADAFGRPPPAEDHQTGLGIAATPPIRLSTATQNTTAADPCAAGCLPPFTYSPPRICPDGLKPTYRLSPDMYASLGPVMRATLTAAGIPWDVDVQPGEMKGRSLSQSQTYFPGPINDLERQLTVAAKLKNCRAM